MGFFGKQVATSTTAAPIITAANGFTTLVGNSNDTIPLLIKNIDSTITIYLGGSTVTNSGATIGYPLIAGASVPLSCVNTEAGSLYAVSASGTPTLAILAGRQ